MEFRARSVLLLCLSLSALALLAPASIADQSLEVKGPITDLSGAPPTQRFKVHGVSFTTNASTRVDDLAGGLKNGAFVKVKSRSTSAPFVATRVKGAYEDAGDSDHAEPHVAKASVEGLVTGLTGTSPNFSFMLDTRRVVTNSATRGLALVAPNAHVEAKGPVDPSGTITATKIEAEDD